MIQRLTNHAATVLSCESSPEPPDVYTIAEAAVALGRTPDRIRKAIRCGAITASHRRDWPEPRITRVALIEFCVAFGICIR